MNNYPKNNKAREVTPVVKETVDKALKDIFQNDHSKIETKLDELISVMKEMNTTMNKINESIYILSRAAIKSSDGNIKIVTMNRD